MQLDGLRKIGVVIDDYRFRIQCTFRTGWWRFPPLPPINPPEIVNWSLARL
jgi:hypothetical protein